MKIGQLGNIEIKDGSALVSVNPDIYTMSAIFDAAYGMCDEAYIMIDGNPSEEVLVELRDKKGGDVLPLVHKFNEELINHIVYEKRDHHTRDIKKMLMQKMLVPEEYEKFIDKVLIDKITKHLPDEPEDKDDSEIQ